MICESRKIETAFPYAWRNRDTSYFGMCPDGVGEESGHILIWDVSRFVSDLCPDYVPI